MMDRPDVIPEGMGRDAYWFGRFQAKEGMGACICEGQEISAVLRELRNAKQEADKYYQLWRSVINFHESKTVPERNTFRECCAQRGARMQIMWEWMVTIEQLNMFERIYPEAKEWFDEDGVPR